MAKFFIKETDIENNKIIIKGSDAKHIKNVLRHSLGDEIICSLENGTKYITSIDSFNNENVELKIINTEIDNAEPSIIIDLYQGLPKSDKMELIIQKTVELGINKIIPIITKRTIVKLDQQGANKKLVRWQKIALEASKQSLRGKVPLIDKIQKIKDLKNMHLEYDLIVVPYEEEKKVTLKEILRSKEDINKIAFFIGPEGGFEREEIELLISEGAKVVSLGNRILRTETAGIATLSMIMYEYDK